VSSRVESSQVEFELYQAVHSIPKHVLNGDLC